MIGTALVIPQHSKNSPKGLLKSLFVETSGMLLKRFFARNSNMILVLTLGLCRASMFVPLNEQGMVVEGERIWIALKEHFTSNNHSFDGSILGETSLEGRVNFSYPKYFKVLPKSPNSIENFEGWITLSFGVRGLGEVLWAKSKDGIGFDSTGEDSSTLDVTFA